MRNLVLMFVMSITFSIFAKNVVTVFKVEAQCEMCKTKIEKALDINGISYAEWNVSTKMVTVKYNDSKIDEMRIHRVISDLGYATEKLPANKDAQNKLAECCQPGAAPMKAEAKSEEGKSCSGKAEAKACSGKADAKACSGKADSKSSCSGKSGEKSSCSPKASTSSDAGTESASAEAAKPSSCAPAAGKPCCNKPKS